MTEAYNGMNTERVYYKVFWDVNQYGDSSRIIFCDEMVGYTIYPYICKLKEIKSQSKENAVFEDAHIYLMNHMTGTLVKVPCNIVEEEKEIYMTDGNFNKYWAIISANIWRYVNGNENHLHISQYSMNDMVNLKYAEKPPKLVRIDKNYKLEYKGVELDIETQRLISKRASALDDSKIKYIYKKSGGFVHDRSCDMVEKIGYMDFEASEELPPDRELCPRCIRQIYIRNSIKNDNKKFAWYKRFMEKGNVSFKTIKRFLSEGNVELHMDNINELQVKCHEDTWIIKLNDNGKYKLYHNNYVMVNETERYITSGFHLQKCHHTTVSAMLEHIEKYSWEKHLETKKGEVAKEETVAVQEKETAPVEVVEEIREIKEDITSKEQPDDTMSMGKNILVKVAGIVTSIFVTGLLCVKCKRKGNR